MHYGELENRELFVRPLSGKSSQKRNKNSTEYSMVITFLHEVMYVIAGFTDGKLP